MAKFNLEDYETVEDRLKRFFADHPDARVLTENLTTEADRANRTWVVKAFVFASGEDLARQMPLATGHAFEVDGTGGANATSALENCETSAIGRALANANYSGNKRASREEMQKVQRAQTPSIDWTPLIERLDNVEDARALYNEARKANAGGAVLEAIKTKVATFG